MAYATTDDIKTIYGADFYATITDLDNDAVVDEAEEVAALTRALESASEFINSHVSARYSLPLDPVPGVLKHACIDIGIYYFCNDGTRITDQMRVRYEDAVTLLERIADGKAGLGLPVDSETGEPATGSQPARMYTVRLER